MKNRHENSILLVSLIAGLLDTSTGLGLVLMPGLTLGMMGVTAGGEVIPFIRFIGAFVLATGSLYLWGASVAHYTDKWQFLRAIWLITAWIRAVVALVTAIMILFHQLSYSWATVPLTDAVLAATQLIWIRYFNFPGNE